jgi:hypothetical protein
MITRRSFQLSRRQAEALVDHAADRAFARDDASAPLRGLLVAAAAATTSIETAREAAALDAFRARNGPVAGHPAGTVEPGQSRRVTVVAFFTSRAIALLTAGAVVTGGVAYAASTGHLPGSSSHPGAPVPTSVSAGPPYGGSSSSARSSTAGLPSSTPAEPTVASVATSTATVGANATTPTANPSLVGLCNAYESGVAASSGKALSNPAFTALVAAAGGVAGVDSYCANLGVTSKPAPAATSTHGPPATPPGQTKSKQTKSASTHPDKP